MRDIGKNIKSLRIQKNMTQDELAQALFVTRQTVSNYETGRSRPDVDTLLRIAEALSVDVNKVLYGPPVAEEQRRKYRSLAIHVGIILLTGLLLLWLYCWSRETASLCYTQVPHFLTIVWLRPAWLLLAGWTAMHILCLTSGTRTIGAPVSRYIKWGILTLIISYGILLLPQSVWMVWCEAEIWLRRMAGEVNLSFSSTFSVFPAWDQAAMFLAGYIKATTFLKVIQKILFFLPLLWGALLRLCRCSQKTQTPES